MISLEGLELGELAKQVKEGAITAAQMEAEKERRKEVKASKQKWIERNWKKLVAAGVIIPFGGVAAWQGIKMSQSLQGVAQQVQQGLANLANVAQVPMKAVEGLQALLKDFSLEGLKLPEMPALKLPKFPVIELPEFKISLPELPKLEIPKFEIPELATVAKIDVAAEQVKTEINKTLEGLRNLIRL